jgi:hypothetical protein
MASVETRQDIEEALRDAKLAMAEQMFSAMDFAVGLWLIIFGTRSFQFSFTRFRFLFTDVPVWVWGAVLVACAACRLLGIQYRKKRLRHFSTLWASFFYGMVCINLIVSAWPGVGTAVFGMLSMKNLAVFVMKARVKD